MESNFLTAVFLPLALFVIMFGMGLGLTPRDFLRVWVEPKAMLLGLGAQLVVLPILGFLLAQVFPLSPELAIGVMILAACPGGPTSNSIVYLIRGNVALSISLTAISSLVTVFTIPLIVNFATQQFAGTAVALELPFGTTVVQIAAITIVPVALGMTVYHFAPELAARIEKSVKWLSLAFLGLIIVGLLAKERENLPGFFAQVGAVTLALNLLAMGLGYGLAQVARLSDASAKSISVEVGIQNGTLAIAVASTLLNEPTMAIPAAIYSLLMFVTSGAFAWILSRGDRAVT
ncbi:MAG: bile acid:sodium symporter family protein [Geitlerinemataceae cyanobacterium]